MAASVRWIPPTRGGKSFVTRSVRGTSISPPASSHPRTAHPRRGTGAARTLRARPSPSRPPHRAVPRVGGSRYDSFDLYRGSRTLVMNRGRAAEGPRGTIEGDHIEDR